MSRQVLFLALVMAARGMAAQQSPESLFAELLGANRYPLSLEHGKLAGPGTDFLVTEASKAQFFAFGEEHNVAEIPALTAALLQRLHDRYGPELWRLLFGFDAVLVMKGAQPATTSGS